MTRTQKVLLGCALGAALLLIVASAIRPLALITLVLVGIGGIACAVSNYRARKDKR
ncbi:hypothetical protein [Paracoccus litorisediminis]|uniref:Uncharacterized protein n=1 Tax=Paracoccus litorisediminis TaxID=2006130 RepID=A0A844HUW7_9RHOB|nr:hypothetical protein [Paracoccus litorisediminis]MTH62137.1 hypothetical protein [Paracoccus litorisediminis]